MRKGEKKIMETLERIKSKIGLSQSIECLEKGLVYSYIYITISTKELAKKMEVSVPIATAFKKELVKYGWMKRESFYFLSPIGKEYVSNKLKYNNVDIETYKTLLIDKNEKELYLKNISKEIEDVFENRPVAKRELDQAHATIDTVIKRVSVLIENPLIFSQNIAFVGDDDLVSILLSKILESLGFEDSSSIFVYDIDIELLDFINKNGSKKVRIQTFEKDFRIRDRGLYEQMDVVFTDPPYTPEGILTFVDFGNLILKTHGKLYVSFNHKTPGIQSFIQKELIQRELNFVEIISNFNHYLGGSIIGNISNLYVLQKNNMLQTINSSESIYTRSLKKQVDSKRLGFHTLYDLRECNESLLTDVEIVKEKMRHISKLFRLNIVNEKMHQFQPYGVSGVMVLKESHFTIHTWPEHQYAAIDLFVCEDMIDEQAFSKELQRIFESKNCEIKKVYRVS